MAGPGLHDLADGGTAYSLESSLIWGSASACVQEEAAAASTRARQLGFSAADETAGLAGPSMLQRRMRAARAAEMRLQVLYSSN